MDTPIVPSEPELSICRGCVHVISCAATIWWMPTPVVNCLVYLARRQQLLVHPRDHALRRQGRPHLRRLLAVLARLAHPGPAELRDLHRELPLQVVHVLQPGLCRRLHRRRRLHRVAHRPEELLARRVHKEGGLDLLGVLRPPDVHVDDAAPPLGRRLLRLGQEVGDAPRYPIVEARAHAEHQVRLLHHEVRRGVPVHAQHVQGQRVPLVKGAQRMQSGGHRDLQLLGQGLELRRGVVAALARNDHRLLRGLDEAEQLLGHGVRRGKGPLLCLAAFPVPVDFVCGMVICMECVVLG
mmetsp:Transcript_123463/g.283052  ORF Transcript_123463/g.283052 Transcript_123463/m.283052 type:complete len:296 (+) Transcript_123463:729-1616(+)